MLAVTLGLLVVLDHVGLAPSPYHVAPELSLHVLASPTAGWVGLTGFVVYGTIALAGLVSVLAPPEYRRSILLVAGVVALPFALHVWALVLFGYVAVAIGVARLRAGVIVRFLLVLVAWASVPVLRVYVLGGEAQAATILLAELWVGMLYAGLYMIVERTRALPGETPTIVDDAFYLLAPPRLIMPFFQPISPRELVASQRPGYPRKLLWRGAGLAGYAIVVAIGANELEAIARHHHLPHTAVLALRFVAHYARAAQAILLAMAVFRLLGFDVAAGFRYPFLSRSFADFFRRYNHYVRDAVVSVFYLPFLGHLRHRLPRRAASIVAAYLGIFIGSLAMQDLLIPAGISLHPLTTVHNLLRPHRIIGMLVMWTLIVVPNAGIIPRRRPPTSRWRAAFQIVLVDAIFVGLWYLQLR